MDFFIGEYKYKCELGVKQLGTFYVQQYFEPIIRKIIPKFTSIDHMYEVYNKTGYYITNEVNETMFPLTWTNDPRILEELNIVLPEPERLTYAILRPNEEEIGEIRKNKLYKFKYENENDFFICLNGKWTTEVSTAFDFLTVAD